jgi:NAD(P)-dependent dehydrogenase (short-subunit alcohol dehydrogenase family)
MGEVPTLTGVRALVVGASSGIGRALATAALAQGAGVAVSARRGERLTALCREAGGGVPLAGDVRCADDCRRVVDGAAEALGGLDLVVYAAGAGTLAPISRIDPEAWRRDLDVNVVGANAVCAAALPHLDARGVVAFLSSNSTSAPRFGLASYAAAKAALDASVLAWRAEHPERRFLRIVLGPTMPTGFGDGFDPETLTTALRRWPAQGLSPAAMETDDVGRHLAGALALVLAHPDVDTCELRLEPRAEPWS